MTALRLVHHTPTLGCLRLLTSRLAGTYGDHLAKAALVFRVPFNLRLRAIPLLAPCRPPSCPGRRPRRGLRGHGMTGGMVDAQVTRRRGGAAGGGLSARSGPSPSIKLRRATCPTETLRLNLDQGALTRGSRHGGEPSGSLYRTELNPGPSNFAESFGLYRPTAKPDRADGQSV